MHGNDEAHGWAREGLRSYYRLCLLYHKAGKIPGSFSANTFYNVQDILLDMVSWGLLVEFCELFKYLWRKVKRADVVLLSLCRRNTLTITFTTVQIISLSSLKVRDLSVTSSFCLFFSCSPQVWCVCRHGCLQDDDDHHLGISVRYVALLWALLSRQTSWIGLRIVSFS